MHQREIDRAAGSVIGGTIAALIVVVLLVGRYPKQSFLIALPFAIIAGVLGAYEAWHDSQRPAALAWPEYDLAVLDSEQARKETTLFRKELKEPHFFKKLDTREFLIRFLPTIESGEKYRLQLRCDAIFYKPGAAEPYAVLRTDWNNTVCRSPMIQPVLGHWNNGVWRIVSLGQPLDEYQIQQLAKLITESTPGEPVYSARNRAYAPWVKHFKDARLERDWISFYEGHDWIKVAF